jgi:hypothetical protein
MEKPMAYLRENHLVKPHFSILLADLPELREAFRILQVDTVESRNSSKKK